MELRKNKASARRPAETLLMIAREEEGVQALPERGLLPPASGILKGRDITS